MLTIRKAAMFNDTKTVWNILRSVTNFRAPNLAPLKTPSGHTCRTTQEQGDEILRHLHTALKMIPPTPQPGPDTSLEILNKYNPSDVALRLNQLPLDKAVPVWSLPGAAYRSVSNALSTPLCHVWNMTATTGLLPYSWDALQLVLIPRPGKNPSLVDNLRPICLSDPLSKS